MIDWPVQSLLLQILPFGVQPVICQSRRQKRHHQLETEAMSAESLLSVAAAYLLCLLSTAGRRISCMDT